MRLVLFLFVFLVFTTTQAQVNQNRCGTFDIMKYKEELTPGYMQRVKDAFNEAKEIATANANSRDAYDTIYRIRCVVHVVYEDAAQNIPDSVILSQIEVLNEDYRRLNADTSKTRGIFLPVAADARIEFALATLDPDGNPTSGITRTVGNPSGFLGFEPFTDNVKSSTTGGKNPWPTDRYLNIWVCNVLNGFGVLGYAFPPDNAPNWPANSSTDSAKQGVVLHYPVVGRNFSSPIDPTVARGRSAVHEIGHFLGLRHIWGDGDCTEDDGIADTPDALDAQQQTCDTSANTCTEVGSVQMPDMIENYMDYSDDRCLNMFTLEQVGIMRAMLQSSRYGIADRVVETALGDRDWDKYVSVYPNPTKDRVTVTMPSDLEGVVSAEVYNTHGNKVKSQASEKTKFAIELGDLPSGLFLLRLANDNSTTVKKLIKSE